jgi:dTMP kinase
VDGKQTIQEIHAAIIARVAELPAIAKTDKPAKKIFKR